MSEKPQPGVLGSLPHSRPHRRSAKRADVPATASGPEPTTAKAKPTTAKAKPTTAAPRTAAAERKPPPAPAPGAMQTAVQAAAELAEIGLQASARALRRTLSRLPRRCVDRADVRRSDTYTARHQPSDLVPGRGRRGNH